MAFRTLVHPQNITPITPGIILMAILPRPRKLQNAEVHKVQSKASLQQRIGITSRHFGVTQNAEPRHTV